MLNQYNIERSSEGIVLTAEKAYASPEQTISGPADLADMFNEHIHLDRLLEEHLYMISFSAKLCPTAIFEVASGTATGCLFSPREVFIRALLCGAVRIAVAHNHTSGDPTPSKEDEMACRRIKSAGELVGISLVDFLIIGSRGAYYSFAEHAGN